MSELWIVDPETQARAYDDIDTLYDLRKRKRGMEIRLRRRESLPNFLMTEAREIVKNIFKERMKRLSQLEQSIIVRYANHPIGCLATYQNMPRVFSAAFVAAPPQVTTKRFGALIKTGNWINNCFLVVKLSNGKKHAPKIAKLCTEATVSLLRYRLYEKMLPEQVVNLFEKKVRQYEQEKGRKGAKIIAIKDAMRVLIGNAWLVWTWIALDAGIIDAHDIVLPYHLAKDPWTAQTMIDPIHTFIKMPSEVPDELRKAVREASWMKLVKMIENPA